MSNTQTPPATAPTADDVKKAQVFFERAAVVAQTGDHEYAIEMYVQGLMINPESMDAYKALRQLALVRSAQGGKDMSYFEKRKLAKVKGPKDKLQNALKLVSYLPQNRERIEETAQAAREAGLANVAAWIEALK